MKHLGYAPKSAKYTDNSLPDILSIQTNFLRLMAENAPHGCLSMNAIAAFPDNELINKAVKEHKEEGRQFLAEKAKDQT